MHFTLVIAELVMAIELATTVLERTLILWIGMHFQMAAEVRGTPEGYGTALVRAGYAVPIGIGVGSHIVDHFNGIRLIGGGCNTRLRLVHLQSLRPLLLSAFGSDGIPTAR